jgi:hypothetical protein
MAKDPLATLQKLRRLEAQAERRALAERLAAEAAAEQALHAAKRRWMIAPRPRRKRNARGRKPIGSGKCWPMHAPPNEWWKSSAKIARLRQRGKKRAANKS